MGTWLASDSVLTSSIDGGEELQKTLSSKNEEELKKLQDKIEDAETNLGETELSDALRAKASYLARIGEKVGLGTRIIIIIIRDILYGLYLISCRLY